MRTKFSQKILRKETISGGGGGVLDEKVDGKQEIW
jgi:hypothetical protein